MKKFFARAKAVLEDKFGEGYIDTAVKMIIAVVIGALLLGGLYYIFNSMILPGLAERIQDMFLFFLFLVDLQLMLPDNNLMLAD